MCDSSDDEDDESRAAAVLRRRFLVPVSKACTAAVQREHNHLILLSQKVQTDKLRLIQAAHSDTVLFL